jgi:hypothetical protein
MERMYDLFGLLTDINVIEGYLPFFILNVEMLCLS